MIMVLVLGGRPRKKRGAMAFCSQKSELVDTEGAKAKAEPSSRRVRSRYVEISQSFSD